VSGVPDAKFSIRRLGMAIGDPGLVQTIDPRTGAAAEIKTGPAAKTTALVAPEHLYVFSPSHRGVLVLAEA
jgi:hypothetical protein